MALSHMEMAFWNREYPAIRDTSALLEAIEACGYETVGHFPLPASAFQYGNPT